MNWGKCLEYGDVVTIQCLEPIFGRIVELAAVFASIVFFIMLLVGGFRFLFSAGNPKEAEAAKGTVTAAILGLILIVAAYIILRILATFTGLPGLTTFKIWSSP